MRDLALISGPMCYKVSWLCAVGGDGHYLIQTIFAAVAVSVQN